MRLKKIRLSGFKSFVDPTVIPISGNLIGVVGPNGCGKSNIIDAVRWVMGESSPRHLRGDSMSDVVFNGSSARKPVGKASVELLFDNSDGRAPDQYSAYAEISIRRELSRDGQSDYFLNKTPCRRKDITDIFLGTGLGPRAYSIIEQGMVTRIIEAKPEELRIFFEEAAGISKYKERRRETENRIKHTRENLARVEDIRNELATQLERLHRQSRAAARYKELRQQERLLRAQLLSLRWRNLNLRTQAHDQVLASRETELEGIIAGQRGVEAEIERLRAAQIESGDALHAVQAQFYAVSNEISALEQTIQHTRDTYQQRLREQEQLERSWQETEAHLAADREQQARLLEGQAQLAPRIAALSTQRAAAAAELHNAEQALQTWQTEWERFTEQAAEAVKTRELQGERRRQLEQQISGLRSRQARLDEEAQAIQQELNADPAAALQQQVERDDQTFVATERRLTQREADSQQVQLAQDQATAQLEVLRGRYRETEARLASLQELQAAALGKHDIGLNAWLQQHALDGAPRLATLMTVEPGWEKAVEVVLGADLGAVCVSGLKRWANEAAQCREAAIAIVDTSARAAGTSAALRPRLLDHIRTDLDLSSLLCGVYVAQDLTEALALCPQLAAHESVVTRDGVWLGHNWLVGGQAADGAGLLQREREIEARQRELMDLSVELQTAQQTLTAAQQQRMRLEAEIGEQRRQLSEYSRERATLHAQLGHQQARLMQLRARQAQIQQEVAEIAGQLGVGQQELDATESMHARAERQVGEYEQRRAGLVQQRAGLHAALEQTRAAAAAAGEASHRVEIEHQAVQTALESVQQSIARLDDQLRHLHARRTELTQLLGHRGEPTAELQQRLEELLRNRLHTEERLAQARKNVTDLETALRGQEQARTQEERKAEEVRSLLEQERVARQEVSVRRETVEEQIREAGHEPEHVLEGVPAEATEEGYQAELERVANRIERLGPINLVAIQEFEEQSQRKAFLDKQYEDLSQALTTLEEAIRKIDRETRARFKDTFERVNAGFQAFFPRLFGGGQAYLELVGDDLLETGVSVMARPPGKRNSTIHLLSGGEKALTAVALLFAIFELNPAPFCLLDEVDASLDDANVERYCETLKTLSQRTQLIFVTHNKISMEMAEVLLGVTMSEPGVSRLVAVDVEEALEMVAQNQPVGASGAQAGA